MGPGGLTTRRRGPQVVPRSRSPQLVGQEVFAFLVGSRALCPLRVGAARAAEVDPDRISFTVPPRPARDRVAGQAAATPAALHDAVEQTIADLRDARLPPRRARSHERRKRPVKNTFSFRKLGRPRPSSRLSYTLTVTGDHPYLGKQAK